jgi:hypothetical protein
MKEEKTEETSTFYHQLAISEGIPGVQALARNITQASEKGVLFFLAVELELLLEDHYKKNGLPPTPVDLEIMIAQAAKAMVGE